MLLHTHLSMYICSWYRIFIECWWLRKYSVPFWSLIQNSFQHFRKKIFKCTILSYKYTYFFNVNYVFSFNILEKIWRVHSFWCLFAYTSTYSDKQGQCKFKIFMNKKYTMYISFLTPILILVQEVLVKLITPIKMLPVF